MQLKFNMSSNVEESLQLSFPLPPNLYKVYTDENLKNGKVPKPPMPITGTYTMFGAKFDTGEDILRPLESQGFPRLYPRTMKFDHLVEIKKLNHSIVLNFLELLDIIIEAPSSEERTKKIEDINVLFINLHHLINEFRPHQARETLRVMLHRQKRQRLETAEKLNQHIDKAKSLLKDCHGILHSANQSHSELEDHKNNFMPRTNGIDSEIQELTDNFSKLENIMCNICDNL